MTKVGAELEVGEAAAILPLAEMTREQLRRINFVLTDIDDTLTSGGLLPGATYLALERLYQSGLHVVPVTGRPAGWCDLIVRLWPVSAVIGENGAFYFARGLKGGMHRVFAESEAQRQENRARLGRVAEKILETVEGACLSSDQSFREADLAIDVSEDGPPLPKEAVQQIVDCFQSAGAMAKVSSIHVNGWFGEYDKLTMARRLLEDLFDTEIEAENAKAIFVGDSPNDAPMFGFFDNSVGVANFMPFRAQVPTPPKYITSASGGAGFVELAEALLKSRDGI